MYIRVNSLHFNYIYLIANLMQNVNRTKDMEWKFSKLNHMNKTKNDH